MMAQAPMRTSRRRARNAMPSIEPRPCDRCPGTMRQALRYETLDTVPVLICWDCGTEDPPMRRQPQPGRPPCGWCGMPFAGTEALHNDCGQRLATFKTARLRAGRAMRRALP